jgi:hypothetical protein
MAMALKRNKLTINEKVKMIHKVQRNTSESQTDTAKHPGLPVLYNVIESLST